MRLALFKGEVSVRIVSVSSEPLTLILSPGRGEASSRAANLLKLKNNFAAALALRGMCDSGFKFAKRISFFDFRFEQAAPGHIEKRSERFHVLRGSSVVV